MMWAASGGRRFKRWRLTQKKGCNWAGSVQVICCQTVWGRVLNAVWIQWSVAFLPQEEQKRDLQECGALMLRRQVGQIKTCQPRNVVRQTSILSTLIRIALRMRFRWARKNRHQLPLS